MSNVRFQNAQFGRIVFHPPRPEEAHMFCRIAVVFAAFVPLLAIAQGAINPTDGAAFRTAAPPPATAASAPPVVAAQAATPAASAASSPEAFAQFGFAPALFLLNYKEKVYKDSKDVRLRSDGAISGTGSKFATSLGVELHYGASTYNKAEYVPGTKTIKSTSGNTYSPFIGLFDIDDGINGLAFGVMYSYWRGDKDYNKTSALNMAIGWTVHKNRLVLADGLKEGDKPTTLTADDFTRRKDVRGMTLTISASFGF
jgi:hypothetical protein